MTRPRHPRFGRLNERQQAIVAHVVRYWHSTLPLIHRFHLPDRSFDAAVKAVAALCGGDWLRKYTLIHPGRYVTPGRRAVRAFGLPPARSRPLGPQSLPVAHAALLYAASDPDVERIAETEITAEFPWYAGEWITLPHCRRRRNAAATTTTAADATAQLELLRVDLGAAADHLARKCAADLRTRLTSPPFRAALQLRCFRITVITATLEKAAAIERALTRHVWPAGLSFRLAVIPPLLPLLPGLDSPHDTDTHTDTIS